MPPFFYIGGIMQFTKKLENFTDTERLLLGILEELQKISSLLHQPKVVETPKKDIGRTVSVKKKKSTKKYTCGKCGREFDNAHVRTNHERNCKGGVKDSN